MGTPGHTDSQHTYHEVPAACLCPLPCLWHQAWSRDLRRVQGRLTGPCGEADHRRLPGGAGRHPHCHPLPRLLTLMLARRALPSGGPPWPSASSLNSLVALMSVSGWACARLGGTPWSGTGPVRSALMSSPRSLSSSRTQRLLRRESLTSRASASADSQTTLTTATTWSLSSSPQPWRFSLES